MGGDCLNTGFVPSKALIKTAKVIQSFKKHKIYGLEDASYKVNFKKAVMEQVQAVIPKIDPHDSVERYSKLGVEALLQTLLCKTRTSLTHNLHLSKELLQNLKKSEI